MKKASEVCCSIFGWGAYLSIFAGALCFVGFAAAMLIGGETGSAISVAIKGTVFPWIIKLASVAVGVGLIGMYLGNEQALSMSSDKKEAEEDLKRNLEEAKKKEAGQ